MMIRRGISLKGMPLFNLRILNINIDTMPEYMYNFTKYQFTIIHFRKGKEK